MAQINLERKRSGAWVWLALGLILFLAVVVLAFTAANREDEEPVGPMEGTEAQALESPSREIGRDLTIYG